MGPVANRWLTTVLCISFDVSALSQKGLTSKNNNPPFKSSMCRGVFFYYEVNNTRNEPEGLGEADLELEDK
jgi:hypothetical protein